jgi:hypothetical protein
MKSMRVRQRFLNKCRALSPPSVFALGTPAGASACASAANPEVPVLAFPIPFSMHAM